MRKLLITLVLLISCMASIINIETGVEQFKIVNGDSALELKLTGSCRLSSIDKRLDFFGAYIGMGFSQQYTAPRSSIFSFNHYGDRVDWSIGWFLGGIEAIYTHSIRNKYAGANPDILFFNSDIDSLKIRYKTEFEL